MRRLVGSLSLSISAAVVAVGGVLALPSCHGDSGAGPVCTDCTPTGVFTGRLPSPSGVTVWTATTMDKILQEAAPPTTPVDSVTLYAAGNEFEPFQVALNPTATGTVTLAMTPFTGPGTIAQLEIRRVGYVKITTPSDASSIKSGFIPDPLELTTFGNPEPVTAGQNQPYCPHRSGGRHIVPSQARAPAISAS